MSPEKSEADNGVKFKAMADALFDVARASPGSARNIIAALQALAAHAGDAGSYIADLCAQAEFLAEGASKGTSNASEAAPQSQFEKSTYQYMSEPERKAYDKLNLKPEQEYQLASLGANHPPLPAKVKGERLREDLAVITYFRLDEEKQREITLASGKKPKLEDLQEAANEIVAQRNFELGNDGAQRAANIQSLENLEASISGKNNITVQQAVKNLEDQVLVDKPLITNMVDISVKRSAFLDSPSFAEPALQIDRSRFP